MKKKTAFRLGNCKIIPIENSIIFDGEQKCSIQPKSIEVLCYLAVHYPSVISREELISNIWGENSIVGDNGLTNAIWHLRKMLKPTVHDGDVIETIRKVGYKLSISPHWEEAHIKNEETPVSASHEKPQIKTFLTLLRKIKYAGMSIILSVLLFLVYSYQSNDFKPLKNTQITKQQGAETHPAPSPDGRFVAYSKVSVANGSTDLYVQDVHNLQFPPKQLTFDEHEEGFSVWSNNGKYLYFSREDEENNGCMIIRLDVSSLQENEITRCESGVTYLYIDISPDDKTLAYAHKEKTDEERGIYFIQLDKKNSTPIRFSCNLNCGYKDRDMAFSPDGKSIAVSRRINGYNENIFLVNLKSKKSVQLTYEEEDILGLTWHPSGKQLIYATQRSDNRYSYTVDLDTKEIKSLDIKNFNFPALAKNANELFYQVLSEQYHISHLQLGEGVATSPFPTIQSEFNHLNSHYSKHSNKIVYSSNKSGYYELWSSDTSGANQKQLTNLKKMVQAPRWSNDGQKIAFLSLSENGKYNISILNVKSHKISKLPSPFNNHNRPTWSYDGKAIISNISEANTNDLYQIDISSGKSKQLTFDKGRLGIMISPNTLLYSIPGKGLWQKNIIEKTPSINIIDSSLFRTRYTWDYGNNGVYFKQKTKNIYQLNFYDLINEKLTPLIRIPKHALKSTTALTYIESSNRLLFTSTGNPQSSIHMLNHPLLQ